MIAGEHRLALPAGFRLGKYNLMSVLGAGGFGITYLAEDYSLGRRVAIKELLPNEIATRLDGSTVVAKTKSEEENLAWARDRFVQEGRALAACDHPNVVNVYEMIEANGTAYMVTKFEEGRSFSEWLKEVGGAPTEKELRAILLPLLSGLEKVHKAGFLHRDLKPENIYLTDDGRPILLDFGSARQAVSDRTTSLTSIVTSGYAPFEQYHEDGKQGAWSDLYALAAVMFRAIHGKKPPEATRRLKDDPCPKLAKEHAGQYSAQFLSAIDKALAVEPQKRPQSVAQWLEMLGELPVRKEIVVPAWWKPWLEKLQQAVELAKAKPYWAGGAGAALLVLILVLSVHKKPVPPVPTPTPTASASASPSFSSSPLPSASTSPRRQTIVVPPPYGNTVVTVSPVPTPKSSQPPQASPVPTAEVQPTAQGEIVQVSPSPVPSPELSPGPPVGFQLDPRLVGTWETKGRWPSNSTRTRTARWTVQNDGHFTFSGPWSDAGALTAVDGNMKWFSNNAAQPVDLTYEFDGDTLITHGPLGDAKWTLTRHSSQQSSRSTRRGHTDPGDSVKREMFRRMFDRMRR